MTVFISVLEVFLLELDSHQSIDDICERLAGFLRNGEGGCWVYWFDAISDQNPVTRHDEMHLEASQVVDYVRAMLGQGFQGWFLGEEIGARQCLRMSFWEYWEASPEAISLAQRECRPPASAHVTLEFKATAEEADLG